MELPQPHSFGAQGRKPIHDFLSLYSPAHQDPTLTPPGRYLKTHDLLQPLERVGKNGDEITITEKPMSMVEHILPGGIGTYSINHISYINESQRSSKPEAAQSSSSDRIDENSNCSSYTAGNGYGFALWEESSGNKGKTGKENIGGNRHIIREGGMKIGGVPWITSPSQSSSILNHPTTNIRSLSSSRHSGQKNQSFVDLLKSAKPSQEDEDDDGEFVIKTETSSHHKVKVEPKADEKPNILRSKHSATEQRRRSKINDRFSMLRDIIPHGDQKRDKASFLLEVIEYIQFLQEKVHKYEDSYQGWSNEPPKTTPWNSQRFTDQPQVPNGASGPALVYAAKLDENNINIAPNIPQKGQNILDTDMNSLDSIKEIDQHPRSTKEASSFPAALQPNICVTEPELHDSRSCATDCSVKWDHKLKEQELIIENGTISISTIYSQGLLSTLTEALQSSGVELSRASISIRIDLGKRANLQSSRPNFKKTQGPGVDQSIARGGEEEENDHKALKRLKTSIN